MLVKTRTKKLPKRSGSAESAALESVRQGNLRRHQGDIPGAESAYRQATERDPSCEAAWGELGCLAADCRRFPEAVECFERILGRSGASNGDAAARACVELLEEIAAARQGWIRAPFTLGAAYEQLGEHSAARRHLARAVQLNPGRLASAEAMSARMHLADRELEQAIAAAERALAADARSVLAHVIRSRAFAALSRMDEATASMRRAVEIQPNVELHNSLVFDLNYLADATPEAVYAEACRWNMLYAAPLAREIRDHGNSPDPSRRLRLGYVSPDLYNHPMAKFLPPVLQNHDPAQFEVFVYSVGSIKDGITAQFYESIENYVPVAPRSSELAERVRGDGIDILVDLAGYTMGPAILAFALKPAPVQVTWMGALCTTGMSSMDYFIGDAHMPCPDTDHLFSETVYRLNRPFFCYRPLADVPIGPSPCLDNGYVTYGCFNNPRKITPEVVKLWSAILHLCPGSRLLLKYQNLDRVDHQRYLREWFAGGGIGPERLDFAGLSRPEDYLIEHARVDVALDPFPYNGGTTTLDAIWMGVPVVTLSGRLPVQRAATSVLHAIGLSDLVAHSPEQYLNLALYLANAAAHIPALRSNVRQALKSSPIMNEIGLVRSVENAYRNMWLNWCKSRAT